MVGRSMSAEWGPWIEHDGKGCPCRGEYVQAIDRGRVTAEFVAGTQLCAGRMFEVAESWTDNMPNAWTWGSMRRRSQYEIIRYRIRKPRGMTILESLLEDLPEGVDA
jgi:hypothetical protein